MRPVPLWLLVTLQGAVSAASLVVEIVAGRMLAPYVGMSLYTWTSIIAVVLAGFSAGHWWGGRLAERPLDRALAATGWALLGAAVTTALAGMALRATAVPVLSLFPHPVSGITALTVSAFFLPSLFAGIPAPVLTQVSLSGTDRQGHALGAMFAAGAVGAIAGTLLAGFVFISWLGSAWTLATVTLVYLAGALLCFLLARRAIVIPGASATIIAALALFGATAPNPCTLESRYFCLRSIDVAADPTKPTRALVIDHLVQGISAEDAPTTMFTDHAAMLDALARLRAPQPDFSSFFIGGGNYALPRSFATRGLTQITVAEIDPAVTALAASDFWFDPATARILHEDARRALRNDPTQYDVIVGDAFTDTAVPQHLVTKEFFELVQTRLTPDGSYLMNVIDYADRLAAVGSLIATLQQVFPQIELWTEARRPEPGERVVMVIVAGKTPTPTDRFAVRSPDRTEFAALSQGFVDELAARSIPLTDDYAPIDRLVGARD
ncbi:fused MFS/spermidine synthase [Mesobacterium sp. TK19101]|uniref:Fused MFS/spermidine synthase n=1 Tax=Mesobacterium hydrothermale TaxID=3111907 RepID=A0ABU6HDG4_9RHOB|nr:fused MFS/spermidine synthase [Mesobacterium sp. TK19101]MEC3860503.1 fused MFS/spermidine synthase [Mesobacterium sp. TK19101]